MGARSVAFGVAVGMALAVATSLQAQGEGGIRVDPAMAKQGANLFVQRGCQGCHTIGKGKGAGPDLAGVFRRRSLDWLKHWLKAPDQMLTSDSTAQALLAQFNNTRMPNLNLSDKEVDALLHYIAREDAKVHGS
jgi:mono/diheme cytochrome c family protein